MRAATSISTTALLVGLFSAQSAFADLTAEETWDGIKALAAQYGEEITGTPKRDGDTLIIENAGFVYALTDIEASGGVNGDTTTKTGDVLITGALGDLTLTEQRDGSVVLVTPEQMSMTVEMATDTGETIDLDMLISHSGLEGVYTGTPVALDLAYRADEVSLDVTEFKVDGDAFDFDMLIKLSALVGTSLTELGELVKVDGNFASEMFTMTMAAADPEGSGSIDLTAEVADLKTTSSTLLPQGGAAMFTDFARMISAGYESKGTAQTGATSMDMRFDGPEGSGTVDIDLTGTEGTFDMGGAALSYEAKYKGLNTVIVSDQIPFPQVTVKADESAFGLTMPIGVTEEPADLRLLTTLIGLEVDDFLWALIDPTALLPRDPATLVVDLSGKAKMLVDVFDPNVMGPDAAPLEGMPAELYALDVDALELDIAGARLTGNGSFEFDNADLVTFGGMPAPDGTLNLELVGGNALLDKLVQLGLVPADQAMGVRMMSGLFARPGDGNDTLISEITVQKDGAVLANGQRLK